MAESEGLDPNTISASKSLTCLSGNDTTGDTEYADIYHVLGLAGDDSEQINLSKFRRIVSDNLDVDASFMYKRVFNAFDRKGNGFLTAKELVSAISVLLQGPFQAQVELGMRVYGKPVPPESGSKNDADDEAMTFAISRMDAILSIVESLQLSSPRARHTLTTDNREKAFQIGEDLVLIIYPKLDMDGDGVISLEDFSLACQEDPSLIQVFGQYLPKNNTVMPSSTIPQVYASSKERVSNEFVELTRPRSSSSSRSSFEGINYLRHSPTIGTMWGRQNADERNLTLRRSERLQPIPLAKQ